MSSSSMSYPCSNLIVFQLRHVGVKSTAIKQLDSNWKQIDDAYHMVTTNAIHA